MECTPLVGTAWAAKFHVWRMDWDESAIALYMDDTLLNTVAPDKLVNKDRYSKNPFMQPDYMLLNLAIGCINVSDPSATKCPHRFEVDYVRVYQKRWQSEPVKPRSGYH